MPLRKIGALWLRKSKDGKDYMSGVLNDISGDIRICVFKNDKKENDKQPDYTLSVSIDDQKQSSSENVIEQTGDEIDTTKIPF